MLKKKRRPRPPPIFTPRFSQPTGTPIDDSRSTINIRAPKYTINRPPPPPPRKEKPEFVPSAEVGAKNPRGLEVKRPKMKTERRSVALTRNAPKLGAPKMKTLAEVDPTKINVKKDAKAFGKFRPEFIHRTIDSGLGDMERLTTEGDSGYFGVNFVQDPTTTTGDEYIFQDIDGSGILRHPAMINDKPVFGGVGVATKLHYKPFKKPKDGREYSGIRNYALDEDSIVGQTINRGDNPQSKPRSWEGTKAGGYSKKETLAKPKPMTLEKRIAKGKVGTIGKTDEEVRQSQAHPQQKPALEPKERVYANVPILKSVNYVAGKMGYGDNLGREDLMRRRDEVSKMRIANRGTRGCEENNTCSEFYILAPQAINERREIYRDDYANENEGKMDSTDTPLTDTERSRERQRYDGRKGADLDTFYNPHNVRKSKGENMPRTDVKQPLGGVSKPSDLNYDLDRVGETLTPSTPASKELSITNSYGGSLGGTNELEVKEGMSYTIDKSYPKGQRERRAGIKPVNKLSVKDLKRLAQNRGIPTTSKEEKLTRTIKGSLFTDGKERKYEEYAPASLNKGQLQRKMTRGLPVDMSYNPYGSSNAPTTLKEYVAEADNNNDFSDGDDDFDLEENPMGDMSNYMY